MNTPYPARRTGLGRSVADIVGGSEAATSPHAPGGLLGGPVVVPLEIVPFPMMVADAAGRVLAVNRRWVDASGLGSDESRGYGWLSALRPEDRLALRSQVERVAAGDATHRAEYAWADGADRKVMWWLASQHRAGERLVGIAVGEAPAPAPARGWPGGAGAATGSLGAGTGGEVGAGAGTGFGAGRELEVLVGELPALLRSVEALLDTLDRLVERLPAPEVVPA